MFTAALTTAPPAARVTHACAHCTLPVPAGLVDPSAERQFCCQGCRTVYEVLHTCNMDRFYAVREGADFRAEPARVTARSFAEFDTPTFADLHVQGLPDGLARTEFYVAAAHCAACVWLLEKLPRVLAGVVEARLDLGRALLVVTYDPRRVALSAVAQALDRFGYPPSPARGSSARQARTLDERRQLIRIAVAGAATGNTMLLAAALYAGLFQHMEAAYTELFRWTSMLIGVVALAWPGAVFFRGAWAAIRTRTPHLDLPIALALGAGGIAGVINTFTGYGEIYFDSLTVLIFLLLVGRWLQYRQQSSAEHAVELLYSLTPLSARRVEGDTLREVPIAALQPGDVVEVRSQESLPADGCVTTGESTVDQSLLTGESAPRGVHPGDAVHAGTVNLSSVLRVTVQVTGEQTRVGRLMKLVAESARRRAPMVQLADRMAGWFLVAVLVLAAGTFGVWWVLDSSRAAEHAIALLIVACPCALGLATPLAVAVAIGRAARLGILIKGGETLERLADPGIIALDKTGTITAGQTTLLNWSGPADLKPAVWAVESHSTHPIARAFCRALADADGHAPPIAEQVRQHAEGGIEGRACGRGLLIGAPAYVAARGVALPAEIEGDVTTATQAGRTPVVIAADGVALAVAAFGDPIRPDAPAALEALRRLGGRLAILSGDHPEVVRQTAQRVGLPAEDALGGQTPEDKLVWVESRLAARTGNVWMVGDGVNDAAALAAASVGIAVQGGAEASMAAAHVYLARPGLTALVDLVHAARRTRRVVYAAMGASLFYNLFSTTLAAIGWINPLVAAVLMPISSVTVLSLAFGCRTFGARR